MNIDEDLYYSAEAGYINNVKTLIDNGADMYYRHAIMGDMPFHCAVSKNHLNCIEYLVEQGFDVNTKNKLGFSGLYLAASNGHLEIMQFLLSKGVDVNVLMADNCSALHGAAVKGSVNCVKALVEAGANVDQKSNYGRTALHLAVINNNTDCVVYLIDKYSKVNQKEALRTAILHEHHELAEIMRAKIENIVLDAEIKEVLDHYSDMNF